MGLQVGDRNHNKAEVGQKMDEPVGGLAQGRGQRQDSVLRPDPNLSSQPGHLDLSARS